MATLLQANPNPGTIHPPREPYFSTRFSEDDKEQSIAVSVDWGDGDIDIELVTLGRAGNFIPPEDQSAAEDNARRVLRLRRAARLEEKSKPQETVHK
jgi:hypothetical protein